VQSFVIQALHPCCHCEQAQRAWQSRRNKERAITHWIASLRSQ